MRSHADFNVLVKIERALTELNATSRVDLNLLYLNLGSYAIDQGNQLLALQYYSKLKIENFGNLLRFKIYSGFSNATSFRLIGKAFACYLQNDKPAEAKLILDFFRKPANRSSLYAETAREFSTRGLNPTLVTALLDSASLEMNRVENLNSEQPNRFRIAVALLTQAPTGNSIQQAGGIIKNQALKLTIQQRMAQALAYRDELFKATEVMPANLSDADQMEFLWNMMRGYAERMPTPQPWQTYEDIYEIWKKSDFTPYVDESN